MTDAPRISELCGELADQAWLIRQRFIGPPSPESIAEAALTAKAMRRNIDKLGMRLDKAAFASPPEADMPDLKLAQANTGGGA